MSGHVTALRAVSALRAALEAEGLARTSRMNGAEMTGWTRNLGSTGFSVRPGRDGGRLEWHLVVSGRPHMRYREYEDHRLDEDGEVEETYSLHEPENPEVVFPRIRSAFAAIGLRAADVRCTDHQTMWDDDVGFEVVTARPNWLAAFDPENRPADVGDAPFLTAVSLAGLPVPNAARTVVPAYALGFRRIALPRASVDALKALVEGERRAEAPRFPNEASIDAAGTLTVIRSGPHRHGLVTEAARRSFGVVDDVGHSTPARTIRDRWGDDVEVWEVPHAWTRSSPGFDTDVPVVIRGEEVVRPAFGMLDAQHGDDVPWADEAMRLDGPTGPRP